MAFWTRPPQLAAPSLEDIRKRARLLAIDDHAVPFLQFFERDGYHIERWTRIENLSQLTDAHFDLILLDLHGVGLRESPELQGLGILRHIKSANPTQLVVAYTALEWSASFQEFFALADAILEKDDEYVNFKAVVDRLLSRRYTPAYFITRMNEALGDQAVLVPKAVPKALKAIQSSSPDRAHRYFAEQLKDQVTLDRVLTIISIAISVLK